jgi:hypothetical protein
MRINWYAFSARNNRAGTYHAVNADTWVQSGQSVCLRQDMTRAGWTWSKGRPPRVCGHCARVLAHFKVTED